LGASIGVGSGNLKLVKHDPVPTAGYPLENDIAVNSQTVESNRPMGNATFTYDIHVTTQTDYDEFGDQSVDWVLVDGDGTRLDFGPVTGAPAAPLGVYCALAGSAGGGYAVQNGGPPGDMKSGGNFTYTFNGQGQLIQLTDPENNAQTVAYDSSGLPKTILDVNTQRSVTLTNDGTHITQISEGSGAAVTNLGYFGGLLSSIQVSGQAGGNETVSYSYNADGTPSAAVRNGDPATQLNFTYGYALASDGVSKTPLANAYNGQMPCVPI
jgi:YD repeat-containing protein